MVGAPGRAVPRFPERLVPAAAQRIAAALDEMGAGFDDLAEVDMNFVMTSSGRFVEVQGTAEAEPFTLEQMDALRTSAIQGINQLCFNGSAHSAQPRQTRPDSG